MRVVAPLLGIDDNCQRSLRSRSLDRLRLFSSAARVQRFAMASLSSALCQVPSWGKAKLTEVVGIDPRSLALLRVSLGLLLIVDLATRAPDFWAFYTNQGILTVAESIPVSGPWSW